MTQDNDEYMKQLEQQRLAFEAQFGSLEDMGFEDKTKNIVTESQDVDSESNNNSQDESENESDESFTGFDEDDNTIDAKIDEKNVREELRPTSSEKEVRKPKVIKFEGFTDTYSKPTKREQKILNTGKSLISSKSYESEPEEEENDESNVPEAENLKHDIELQRFLHESHLLSALGNNDSYSGADLTLKTISNNDVVAYQDDKMFGKVRSRTLEMRLKNLSDINGHEKKINRLEKVPMNIRKGMVNKHQKRINRYEQDAKDGGIILSKVKKGQFRKIDSTYKKDIERRIGSSIKSQDKTRNARRERGLPINSVGRSTRNGLIISKEEIMKVNGPVDKRSKNKKRGGRRH